VTAFLWDKRDDAPRDWTVRIQDEPWMGDAEFRQRLKDMAPTGSSPLLSQNLNEVPLGTFGGYRASAWSRNDNPPRNVRWRFLHEAEKLMRDHFEHDA